MHGNDYCVLTDGSVGAANEEEKELLDVCFGVFSLLGWRVGGVRDVLDLGVFDCLCSTGSLPSPYFFIEKLNAIFESPAIFADDDF